MNLESIKSVYFIGAGGIGMSALIRYFLSKGKQVGGYDKVATSLTQSLISEGASIHYEDNLNLINEAFKRKESTLIVFTPAIPENNKELSYFKENGFILKKRAEVLGLITKSSRGLCVAGTHGKTTTSTILAHLLHQSEVGCTAFLGGISQNYHTNLLIDNTSPYTVIEADEFDRSFHFLNPYISIVTAVEPDHLDIYKTAEAYYQSFEYYTSLISNEGALLLHKNVKITPQTPEGTKVYTYSAKEGDFHAENITISNGNIYIDFVTPKFTLKSVQLGVPILVNIDNSIAAMAVAYICGVTAQELADGMKSFKGVERRFDFLLKSKKHVLINDYAHHPAEVKQSILSVRALYPERKLTVLFQPHLYSRTNDFYQEFAQSLSLADELILLPIYPAREEPIEGVSSKLIYDQVSKVCKKHLVQKDNLMELLNSSKKDVILTLGAGDINLLTPKIKELLESR